MDATLMHHITVPYQVKSIDFYRELTDVTASVGACYVLKTKKKNL